MSRQSIYKWSTTPVSQWDWDDAHVINAALDIHADEPAFGCRFITDELPEYGITTGENRPASVLAAADLLGVRQERGLNRKAGPPVHDDRRPASSLSIYQIGCGSPTSLSFDRRR
ncbi:putative transposase [Rhodococcus opacus B4]|uniref:Putative transposase n=1 Tax=Rhodococcus opacus (strain B4) TaxID=632772 RepID=C1B669_RHOOB|nr:putative transposase [Rhodococcus opacus B4]